MRYLFLLRHANALAAKPDKKRALDEKGVNQARQLGIYLSKQPRINLIKLSDATRTEQTFEQLIKTLGYSPKSQGISSLYNATPDQILQELRKTDDNVNNLMIIGHNPGITMVAQLLNINMEAKWASLITENQPTAKVTIIKSEADSWQNFTKFNNQIIDVYWPEQ